MNNIEKPRRLLTDGMVAEKLGLKPVTVRVQRCHRRSGREHWLSLDWVMVGSRPRYVEEDVDRYIENLPAIRAPPAD